MTVSTHSHHSQGLDGSEFVVLAIEVPPREKLWQSDHSIPLKYGVRQPYSENGGPGGFAHAARNIGPVLDIVHDMEVRCPDALLINFTNPMARICDAVTRYSSIRVVGLCHQIKAGYAMVGKALGQDLGIEVPEAFTGTHASPGVLPASGQVIRQTMPLVSLRAAGLNHFTWMLGLHDRRSGEDLYPLFSRRWAEMDPSFEPLTRSVYEAMGWFPVPGDQHLCEYLPWVSDPVTQPWKKFDLRLYEWDLWAEMRDFGYQNVAAMADHGATIDHLRESSSEGAVELIESIAGADDLYHMAANVPNAGTITNLPQGAIVEVPAVSGGLGVSGVGVGPLPDAVAELCRREIAVTQLCVDAAVHGDRLTALQCLLLDPVITDLDVARQVLDDYLESYREHLPQFWD
jgi:alpha-galactosidase